MRRHVLGTVKVLLFLLIVAGSIAALTRVFMQKDSVVQLQPFMDSAQEYDVLFIGDSQVKNSIYPLEMYRDYGIASYNLASVNSTIPVTYWSFLNALKYCSPKVVCMTVKDAEMEGKLPAKFEFVHTALDAYPLRGLKLQAILDLTSNEEKETKANYRTEMIFPLMKYHSRWSMLTSSDFEIEYNTEKGAEVVVHVSDPRAYSLEEEGEYPESGAGFAYLRKIIEACEARGIQLVLWLPPHPSREKTIQAAHTAARIAEEYGTPFLDFVEMDRVVDYATDCSDPESHVNPSGGRKLTDFMGDYLSNNYRLPDRRGESAYAHWDAELQTHIDEKIRLLRETTGFRERLMLLHDSDFSLVLTVRGDMNYRRHSIKNFLHNIVRGHVYEYDDEVSSQLRPLELLSEASSNGEPYMLIVDREDDAIYEMAGYGEKDVDTAFGEVFCRMDEISIDLSLTGEDGQENYYFTSDEEQEEDIRVLVIDRRTNLPVAQFAMSDSQ